jgi:hypothetical protein
MPSSKWDEYVLQFLPHLDKNQRQQPSIEKGDPFRNDVQCCGLVKTKSSWKQCFKSASYKTFYQGVFRCLNHSNGTARTILPFLHNSLVLQRKLQHRASVVCHQEKNFNKSRHGKVIGGRLYDKKQIPFGDLHKSGFQDLALIDRLQNKGRQNFKRYISWRNVEYHPSFYPPTKMLDLFNSTTMESKTHFCEEYTLYIQTKPEFQELFTRVQNGESFRLLGCDTPAGFNTLTTPVMAASALLEQFLRPKRPFTYELVLLCLLQLPEHLLPWKFYNFSI